MRGVLQLLAMLACLSVWAQDTRVYEGSVLEDTTGLDHVEIVLVANDQILGYSDSTGHFQVTIQDFPKVKFRKQGYLTIIRTLNPDKNIISMYEEVNLLDQVVFSEGKIETKVKRTTITLDLIKPKLIEQTAPSRIQESINRVNGVQIIDGQANIRSGSGWSYGAGSRVQVLVNDLPMLSGDAGQAQWSFVPTEGVERIEIIKGAASVIYGSSALNGVINIKTKTHSEKPETYLSMTTGVYDKPKRDGLAFEGSNYYNLSNLSAFHVGKLGSLDLSLGVNMLYDQGYKMSDHDNRGRTTLGLRKVLTDRNMVFGINTGFQMGNSSNFLLWESYEQAYTSLDSGVNNTQSQRLNIDPYFSWTKGSTTHKVNGRYLKVSNANDNGDSSNDQSNYSDMAYLEYQIDRKLKWDARVLAGYVLSLSESRSPLFNGNHRSGNTALYLQFEKGWFNDKLLTNAGMRYEYFRLNSRSEAKPVFRFGMNWEATPSTFFRFSAGQGYRFPSVAEAYVTTSVGPVTIFPNEDIRSETGNNIELGLKQAYKFKAIRGFIDIAAYRMDFNNMTEFLFDQWGPVNFPFDFGIGFKAINAGRTRISGLEISTGFESRSQYGKFEGFVGYNYSNAVSLDPQDTIALNYADRALNYQNTSSTTDGVALKYRPKHSVKGDIIWSKGRWSLGYGLAYQSAFESIDTAFVGANIPQLVPGMDTAMNKGLSSFVLHNARLGFKVYKNLRLNIIVTNLTNREFMIRPGDLGEPRSYRFQISYTFK